MAPRFCSQKAAPPPLNRPGEEGGGCGGRWPDGPPPLAAASAHRGAPHPLPWPTWRCSGAGPCARAKCVSVWDPSWWVPPGRPFFPPSGAAGSGAPPGPGSAQNCADPPLAGGAQEWGGGRCRVTRGGGLVAVVRADGGARPTCDSCSSADGGVASNDQRRGGPTSLHRLPRCPPRRGGAREGMAGQGGALSAAGMVGRSGRRDGRYPCHAMTGAQPRAGALSSAMDDHVFGWPSPAGLTGGDGCLPRRA